MTRFPIQGPRRDSLLLNCAKSEAAEIRSHAAEERRSVSGYVMNTLMRALRFEDQLFDNIMASGGLPVSWRLRPSAPGPRTTVHVHCSGEEAKRIRAAAKRRKTTMCGFVLQ